LELLPKPLLSALLIRGLSRGTCTLEDATGASQQVGLRLLARLAWNAGRDAISRPRILRVIEEHLAEGPPRAPVRFGVRGRPLYLRTDLVFGLTSGGSVGHTAGVLNNLEAFTDRPIFATTDRLPTVRPDIETWIVRPDGRFRDFNELPAIAFNLSALQRLETRLKADPPAFVYQRYSLGNFTGAALADRLGVPFVLEYNGSELWIQRNWAEGRLKYADLAERIETFNLQRADLIVVVSDVMADELRERGVEEHRVLVNPNGVDIERYRPDLEPAQIREELAQGGRTVLGFIGTFGPWHGAEALAEAFVRLLRNRPEYRDRVRLLMIGDGDRFEATRRVVLDGGAENEVVFTGRTAQEDGPALLAACDILVSPHVPNADGSRFFGSPTKLFEYMAMGRGIAASDLEQIGQVLEHDRTAWLVPPGDVDALVEGLRALIDDPERRARLGVAAREVAVARHTWREHTRRIIERLEALHA
jgi:glycosyltransferase involved in cell wall biosynthesis